MDALERFARDALLSNSRNRFSTLRLLPIMAM